MVVGHVASCCLLLHCRGLTLHQRSWVWPICWVFRSVCGDSAWICQQKQCQLNNSEKKQQLGKLRGLVFSVQKLSSNFKTENMVVGFLAFSQAFCVGLAKQDVGILQERAEGLWRKSNLLTSSLNLRISSHVWGPQNHFAISLLKYSRARKSCLYVRALLWLPGCLAWGAGWEHCWGSYSHASISRIYCCSVSYFAWWMHAQETLQCHQSGPLGCLCIKKD